MMRITSVLTLFALLLITSCFEPPQYSIIPKIAFENVRTIKVAGNSTPDSLIVSITFRDGDGDLGREGSDIAPPFNQKWYFLINPIPTCERTVTPPCKKVSFIDAANLDNVVKYSMRRTDSNYDTLPPYAQPFDCDNYEKLIENGQVVDTVYIQRNLRTYNYFCDLYTKETSPSGPVFVKYNWRIGTSCPLPGGGLYGRFDVLGKDGNPDLGLPVEGLLKFRFASSSLFTVLGGKTLKLKIKIIDRAGHFSNEVESREFTLN